MRDDESRRSTLEIRVIEITRFRLVSDVREADFLQADRAVQEGFAYLQPGLKRRTTARDDEGNWIVIDVWRSESDADACATRWEDDPTVQRFMALVDRSTTSNERYKQLD